MTSFRQGNLPISPKRKCARYLDYAMSVIVGRAARCAGRPQKAVHRRVLYAMHELNNDWNRPYKKSARIVGDVIGKYHRTATSRSTTPSFAWRRTFSCATCWSTARATSARSTATTPRRCVTPRSALARIAHEMLADIDKETVDFGPTTTAPSGAAGAADPPAQPAGQRLGRHRGRHGDQHPPHNLNEVVDACLHLLATRGLDRRADGDHPGARLPDRRHHLRHQRRERRLPHRSRPRRDARQVPLRGHRPASARRSSSTRLPYQVNKKTLLERIAELVHEKKIEGISHIQDESDKSGMRLVIELKRRSARSRAEQPTNRPSCRTPSASTWWR